MYAGILNNMSLNAAYRHVASILLVLLVLVPFTPSVHAASLSNISDTISTSAPSTGATHVIQFTASTSLAASAVIKVQFDPTTDLFNLAALTNADISASGFTVVSFCGAGLDEAAAVVDNTAPDRNVTFTVCPGDSIASGTKAITFANTKIVNPSATGTYIIRNTWGTETGDALVAIMSQVVVTATVDTSLTFTITGVANGASVNGDAVTTSTTTTSTLIPFGSLASGTPKVAAQDLSVATNALSGYAVTVRQNQNLTSSAGADIDVFKDSAANVTPTAWTAPLASTTNENTWGHYGVTSEDATLPAGDEFGTALYAGNFATTSRVVMYHNGISDGSTANIGATRVGFKIQVSGLQEAGSDYTNQITYVCTPIF